MEDEYKVEMIRGNQILSSHPKEDRDFRVKKYDFKKPDKFSMEQIRTLSIVHETFSRLTTVSLSALAQKKIEMEVSMVDQLTYVEFIEMIPDPGVMAIVNMRPLQGSAVLQIDKHTSLSLFDRLFGGTGQSVGDERALSAMERSVSALVMDDLLGGLKTSWNPLIELEPSIGQIETNPQMAQIVPPTEMVVLISFKVLFQGKEGRINFCIPFLTIEPLIEKLSVKYWYSMVRNEREDCVSTEEITSLDLDCQFLTESEDLSLKKLGELKKGSLVSLKSFGEGHSFLRAGGQDIMEFQHKKNRNAMSFTVTGSQLRESGLIPGFLNPVEKEEIEKKSFMEDLSVEIRNLSISLNEKIDRLSLNQEELNDQVFFREEGQAVVQAGKEPFSYIGLPDVPVLYELLLDENPQAVALILSRLDSGLSAELLSRFHKEKQPDLVKRIGLMERVTPQVIDEMDTLLKNSFNRMANSSEPDVKGVEKVVQILNLSPRSVESHVILTLDESDNALSEEIKKRMFVFEDIVLLDPGTVARLAEKVDVKDLCLAMKMVAEDSVKKHILSSISPQKSTELKACLEEKGRVLISEVDKAQQRIVAVIKKMEEEGEIIVGRADEMIG
jgi:flagellar motor switch protein FliM